jgi:hypothetical protein
MAAQARGGALPTFPPERAEHAAMGKMGSTTVVAEPAAA